MIIVFLCFFTPLSLNLLAQQYGSGWKWLEHGVKAGQILLATAGYILWILDHKRQKSLWFIALVLHICIMAATGLLNRNTSLTTLGGLYANAGFCLLCVFMYTHAKEDFLRSGFISFAVLAVWGVISIYLFPRGFFHADRTYSALYGLGAKNNAFPFYFTCFFFWHMITKNTGTRFYIAFSAGIVATLIAAYICESTNTMICMALVLVLSLFYFFLNRFFAKLNPVIFLAAFIALIALVYTGLESELLASLLAKFNRSLTFSGRTTLWKQAADYFSRNPLLGAGSEIVFTLPSRVTSAHAHSQWLDRLAKYGIIPMILLVFVVVRTFYYSRKTVNRGKANLLCGMLLIYMLHMSFDTYNYNFFTLFVIIANNVFDEDPAQVITPEEKAFNKFAAFIRSKRAGKK